MQCELWPRIYQTMLAELGQRSLDDDTLKITCIGCVVMLLDHREQQSADFGVFCSAEA